MKLRGRRRGAVQEPPRDMRDLDFLRTVWLRLSPRERLRRAWRLRKRLKNPQAVHDAKLWPSI